MCDKEEMEKPIDNITEQEREYAQNALNEYKKKNYNNALHYLTKLDSRSGTDFKVAHNKALLELCKSDFKRNDVFQKNLYTICNQFRIYIEKLDDVDHCILHFNRAILFYHQRQYTDAIKIMDKVYKFIEPMDDTLAKQISLFAIELQLCIRQPDKAMSLINYLENQLINGTPNIKIWEKNINKEKDRKIQQLQHSDSIIDEDFKKKLLKYKVRCNLMNHNLDICSKELQLLSKYNKNNIDALFLNANYEYLKGNLQESIKILTSIPKDCLVYNEIGESSNVLFYNNLGIIHHTMGKFNLACHYYQMALKEDIAISANCKKDLNDKPLYTLGGSKYHELIYNLGISLLHAGKPSQAFDCFTIAVRRYHRNSRLWIRLAECCIMLHKESNEIDFDLRKEFIIEIIGKKDLQKFIMTTNLSNDKKYSTESQSYAIPVPTLEFASICLRNAYLLLPSDTISSPLPLFLIPGVIPPIPPSTCGTSPSTPLTLNSIGNLRNSILAASAYVSLCLGDYILALEHSENLLAQTGLSNVHKLLGHLYSAEALVLLDKVDDAILHLKPETIKDLSFDLPTITIDEKSLNNEILIKTAPPTKWYPNTLTSAHAVMHYNIAVAKTIKGQLDEAIALLKQVWHMRNNNNCKVPIHTIMLVIYIELQLGHVDSARNLIKQYLFLRKPNS